MVLKTAGKHTPDTATTLFSWGLKSFAGGVLQVVSYFVALLLLVDAFLWPVGLLVQRFWCNLWRFMKLRRLDCSYCDLSSVDATVPPCCANSGRHPASSLCHQYPLGELVNTWALARQQNHYDITGLNHLLLLHRTIQNPPPKIQQHPNAHQINPINSPRPPTNLTTCKPPKKNTL